MRKDMNRTDSMGSHNEQSNHATLEQTQPSISWEGLSESDKKMTFREFLLHYNEDAFELEMPDGTKEIAIP